MEQSSQVQQQFLSFVQLISLVNIIVLVQVSIGLVMQVLGLNRTRRHSKTDNWVHSLYQQKPVIHVRQVTKGTNKQQMIESCIDIQKSIQEASLAGRAEWHVEVLTDFYIELGELNSKVTQIVVPEDQVTPAHSLFKARALHQAATHHAVHPDAWILHMDEESYFNSKNGHKIVDHCDNENQLIRYEGQRHSFANGFIVYTKQDKPDSMFFTLMDTFRVADDHLKMSWSQALFNRCQLGIKGSCWIIHSEIERRVGFDVRHNRSIGEDWVTSFNFNEAGYPIKWMDAVIEEQSPFNWTDFMKQRNRWQKANLLNAFHSTRDYTFPLSFFLYQLAIMYYACPFALLNAIIGLLNQFFFMLSQFELSVIPIQLIPMPKDEWQRKIMALQIVVVYFQYLIGYQHAGFEKYSLNTYILGWLLFFSGAGLVVSGYCEMMTCLNFIFFVDKKSLEFKVIDKNSKFDKFGLRGKPGELDNEDTDETTIISDQNKFNENKNEDSLLKVKI